MRTALLLACYCVSVTAANVLLNLSAHAGGVWLFLAFQAAGNLAGLAGILVYTGLMRRMPLHVAFPVSRGVGVLGVQLVGAVMVFRETFTLREAVGAAVVAAGILLVGFGTPGGQAQGNAPDLLDGGA
jgi:multidrug transporter EmrE-like cation transporter